MFWDNMKTLALRKCLGVSCDVSPPPRFKDDLELSEKLALKCTSRTGCVVVVVAEHV